MIYFNLTTEVSTVMLFMMATIRNNLNFYHYRINRMRNIIQLTVFYTLKYYRYIFIDLEKCLPCIVR